MNAVNLADENILAQWQSLVETMARAMRVPSANITRVVRPHIEVLTASANPENPYKPGTWVELAGHYCEEVVHTKGPMLLPDARKSPQWRDAPEIDHGMVSYLGLPVCWPDGEVFGTICILDKRENHYSPEYRELMEQFRALLESHLELICQRDELRRHVEEINRLRGILPICAHCKRIRDDDGYWQQVEQYIHAHSDASFSHGICPECAEEHYPEFWSHRQQNAAG